AKHYSYDPLSQLLGVARERGEAILNVTNESFRYDSTGNLIARLVASSSPSVPFVEGVQGAAGDRLHQFVTCEVSTQTLLHFTYDGHGNRASRTAQVISDKPVVKAASGILERLLPRHNASEPSETALPPNVTRYRY
ncbi:hypothetical protein L7Q78_45125, partial [Achromobacter xylosoxidans]|nr:hypothetical protein [Achromobacter xylosoxidans]